MNGYHILDALRITLRISALTRRLLVCVGLIGSRRPRLSARRLSTASIQSVALSAVEGIAEGTAASLDRGSRAVGGTTASLYGAGSRAVCGAGSTILRKCERE